VPEIREVYDMVTKQRSLTPGALERQRKRQRRSLRNRKLGTIAVSAALVVVAVLVVVLNGTDATDRGTLTNEPAGQTVPPSEPGAYLVDLQTGRTTQVPGIEAGGFASWDIAVSPDGMMVAYPGSDPEGRRVINVANVDGTNVRALEQTAHSGLGPVGPQFSPDGSRIVYQAGGPVGDIFVVDVATGETTQVTHLEPVYSDLWYMGPNFSPDGETVFFTLPIGDLLTRQRWDLWSVPASGGTPRLVIRGAIGGRISPDGGTIVYFKHEPTSPNFLGDMWLADADGTDARRLGAVRGDVFSARWSPDGTRIAFTNEVRMSAYIVDVATGEVSRVVDDVIDRFPAWVDEHTWIIRVN
jgi:Tol biopolymer transport system component